MFIVPNKVEVVLGRGLKAWRIGAVQHCELTYKGNVSAFRDMTWIEPGELGVTHSGPLHVLEYYAMLL